MQIIPGQYGNNRGFNNFDNRRGNDDYHQRGGGRGFDHPRDFRRDRYDRNDRFERGDRNIERSDRIIERGDRNIERGDRNIERGDRIERRGAEQDRGFDQIRVSSQSSTNTVAPYIKSPALKQDRPTGYRSEFQGNGSNDNRNPLPSDE